MGKFRLDTINEFEEKNEEEVLEMMGFNSDINKEIKNGFIERYMKNNPQEACDKCVKDCDLYKTSNQCFYVGLSFIQNDYGNTKVQQTKKGFFDGEGFAPMTQEEINKMQVIM